MKAVVRLLLVFCVLSTRLAVSAQGLGASEKHQVIDSLCQLLKSRYVFPDIGRRLARYIAERSRSGAYGPLIDPRAFADTLTQDLYRESKDRHFEISFDSVWVADSKASIRPADSLALRLKRAQQFRDINYGFRDIRNLDGNIGYLKLTRFADPVAAGPVAVAAMNSLSGSDALIIDLRDNGGGFKEQVDLMASYLFDAGKDFALPYVPGTRMTDIPVYVLINRYTYSAAEGFSQLLKRYHRATLVGENTGGAAHGIERLVLSPHFYINMPVSRPDPDWEGVGIAPDIRVNPAQAMDAALLRALEDLSRLHPEKLAEYQWLVQDEQAAAAPVTVPAKQLEAYSGSYGNRRIYLDHGQLYYRREGDIPYRLAPMSDTLFRFVDTDDIRICFIVHHGKADQLQLLFKDGGSKILDKTSD